MGIRPQRLLPVLATALVWALAGTTGAAVNHTSSVSSASGPEAVSPAPPPAPLPPPAEAYDSRAAETTSATRLRTCLLDPSLIQGVDGQLALAASTPSGEQLVGINEAAMVAPASVVKLFTAVAALNTLGSDFRFRTTVVQGVTPGDVWLVGGGDVTLTRQVASNYYNSEASLEDLAQQTVDRLAIEGISPTRVLVDTSRYASFPPWDDSWRPGSSRLGFIAPVSALQVDADRDQPAVRLSPRSTDPAARAGRWFADALSRRTGQYPTIVQPGSVDQGRAPEGRAPEGRALAVVESAPLEQLIHTMLVDSDNSLAEVIAREVALRTQTLEPGRAVLDAVGLPPELREGVSIQDGSGLSDQTTLSAQAVLWLLRQIAQSPQLLAVREGLPVASETGSLRTRYTTVAGQLDGRVTAKTGSLRGVRSLAGFVTADDGQEVVFSVVVSGPRVSNDSRDQIDRIVADLARCGENLADWAQPDSTDLLG